MFNKILILLAITACLLCCVSAQSRITIDFFEREAGDVILYENVVSSNLTLTAQFHDIFYYWESEEDVFTSIRLDVPFNVSYVNNRFTYITYLIYFSLVLVCNSRALFQRICLFW